MAMMRAQKQKILKKGEIIQGYDTKIFEETNDFEMMMENYLKKKSEADMGRAGGDDSQGHTAASDS